MTHSLIHSSKTRQSRIDDEEKKIERERENASKERMS